MAADDTPEARQAIGARIREAREACGYANASIFADDIGVRQNTVYRYERGEIVPSIFSLYRVARATGVTMEWLLTGDGIDDLTSDVLDAWLRTPVGQTASGDAVAFLRGLPLRGYVPSPLFYELALTAWRAGLTLDEASRAARTTARHR